MRTASLRNFARSFGVQVKSMAVSVSTTERLLLLGLVFAVSMLFAAFFTLDILETDQLIGIRDRIPFSFDVVGTRVAGFHLMTLVIFIVLVLSRKYVVSTILTGLYGLFLTTSYYFRLDGTGALGGEGFYINPLREFVDKSHIFDFVAAVFIAVALIWQLTIWFRSDKSGR